MAEEKQYWGQRCDLCLQEEKVEIIVDTVKQFNKDYYDFMGLTVCSECRAKLLKHVMDVINNG